MEASLGWSSPGDHLALNGNITWQDLRNLSYEGGFGELVGDRIPPHLGCSLRARVLPQLESIGRRDTKQVVSSQPAHTAGVLRQVQRRVLAITSTMEMHNLTNARTFDLFGAQRPDRGIFAKMVAEY